MPRTTSKPAAVRYTDAAVQEIVANVLQDDRALVRALDILFSKQTLDERVERTSKYHNMQGLRWAHGKVMADIAISLYQVGRLTDEQKLWLRGQRTPQSKPRIAIYWKQITQEWNRAAA